MKFLFQIEVTVEPRNGSGNPLDELVAMLEDLPREFCTEDGSEFEVTNVTVVEE